MIITYDWVKINALVEYNGDIWVVVSRQSYELVDGGKALYVDVYNAAHGRERIRCLYLNRK